MYNNINVSEECVEKYTSNISSAASYFKINPLIPYDAKSTISANAKGQVAYYNAQEAISLFGAYLEQEALNIRSLGASFLEFDELLETLWEKGSRYPVIRDLQ